jgi:uncharacterized membrane protein YecN with MAPEG domain
MEDAPIADAGPAAKSSLGARQTAVAGGMLAGVAVTVVLFGLGMRPAGDAASRGLVFALAALGPLTSLVVAIGALANRRFLSIEDIDAAAGGPPSRAARMAQAVIQNTLEQAVLALGVYAILAMLLPAGALFLPWAMAGAFVVGRLAFALGYRFGAGGRAFGFALTFYPTVAGLIYAAALAIRAIR